MEKILNIYAKHKILSGVTIAVMFLYQLYFIFYGLDFQDSFYHVNRMISNDPFVMTFLSHKIGYFWSLAFGNQIIGFRLFNLLLYFSMLFLPMWLLQEKSQRVFNILLALVLNFFLALLNWNILGYDSFSFLSIISVCVGFIRFTINQSFRNLLLLGILSALCIATRLPNVLILPILYFGFVAFSVLDNRMRFWKTSLLFSIIVTVFFCFLVWLCYGSIFVYWNELLSSFSIKDEDHGIATMLYNYGQHGIKILYYGIVLSAFYFLYSYIKSKKVSALYVVLLAIIPLFLYVKKIHASGFNTKVSLFMAAVLIVMIILQLFQNISKKEIFTAKNASYLWILFFMGVPCFGSNSGLKYAGIFLVMLPYIYINITYAYKKYFVILLIVLIPFAIIEKFQIKFMDEKQSLLTENVNINLLEGIHTTPEKVKKIDAINQIHQQLKKEKKQVYFYGVDSYIFNYLLEKSKRPFLTYPMKLDNEDEIQWISTLISKQKPTFIIVSNAVEEKALSPVEKNIVKQNYKRSVYAGFVVLEPNNNKKDF